MARPAEEEERLVAAVVKLREVDRSADQRRQFMVAERSVGTLQVEVSPMQKRVVNVPVLALEVELIGPRLVGEAEHATGGVAVFSRQDRGHHLDFFDGV